MLQICNCRFQAPVRFKSNDKLVYTYIFAFTPFIYTHLCTDDYFTFFVSIFVKPYRFFCIFSVFIFDSLLYPSVFPPVSLCHPPLPSSVPIQVDFLALEMRKGKVSFLWDVGSGVGRVEYPHLSISDGKWHRIEASRWDDHTHTHQHVRTHTHAHTDACSPARTRTHTLWPYETWNWIEKLLKLWKSHKISMEWLSNRILYTGQ